MTTGGIETDKATRKTSVGFSERKHAAHTAVVRLVEGCIYDKPFTVNDDVKYIRGILWRAHAPILFNTNSGLLFLFRRNACLQRLGAVRYANRARRWLQSRRLSFRLRRQDAAIDLDGLFTGSASFETLPNYILSRGIIAAPHDSRHESRHHRLQSNKLLHLEHYARR